MKEIPCKDCKMLLSNDEVAINIKLLGKQIGILRCYHCLANILSCSEVDLRKRTRYFKNMGCTLFQVNYIEGKE